MVYESPYRIIKLLIGLKDLGFDRRVLIGREMTKKFEEYLTGSLDEVLEVLDLLKRGVPHQDKKLDKI